jgi:hypothetical protein
MSTVDVFWPALAFLASALLYVLKDSVKKNRIAISGERMQTGPEGKESDYQFIIQNLESGSFDGTWTLELTQTQNGTLLRTANANGPGAAGGSGDPKPRVQFLCGPIWTREAPEADLGPGVLYKVSGNQFPALTAWTLSCVTDGKEGNLAVRFTYGETGDTVIVRAAGEDSNGTKPLAWYFSIFWFGFLIPVAAFVFVSGLVAIGPSGVKRASHTTAEDMVILLLFVVLDLLCLSMFAGNPAPRLHHRAGTD